MGDAAIEAKARYCTK